MEVWPYKYVLLQILTQITYRLCFFIKCLAQDQVSKWLRMKHECEVWKSKDKCNMQARTGACARLAFPPSLCPHVAGNLQEKFLHRQAPVLGSRENKRPSRTKRRWKPGYCWFAYPGLGLRKAKERNPVGTGSYKLRSCPSRSVTICLNSNSTQYCMPTFQA